MGYYTEFTIEEVTGPEEIVRQFVTEVASGIVKVESYGDELKRLLEDESKWYDHEDDMKIISKSYPNIIITLRGVGEEQPDLWVKHFCNGQMQKSQAVITYPPVDPSKFNMIPDEIVKERQQKAKKILELREALDELERG